MRRIQIDIEETVDDRLEAEARRQGVSKAALIRRFVDIGLAHDRPDPLDSLAGTGDGGGADDLDEIIYDR